MNRVHSDDMTTRTVAKRLAKCLAIGVTLLFAGAASAATYTWTGLGGSGDWDDNNNWNTVPTFDAAADLIFTGATQPATFLSAARTIKSLTFDANADTPLSIRLATTAGGGTAADLTLGGGDAPAIIIDADASAAHTLGVSDGSILLAGDLTVTHNGPANFLINRPVTGTFGLAKAGTGTMILGATNTYSGPTTVGGGTLTIASDGGLLGTSGLRAGSGGVLTIAAPVTVIENGVFAVGNGLSGVGTINIEDGAVVSIGTGPNGRTYIGGYLDGAGSPGSGILNINGGLLTVAAPGTQGPGDPSCLWINAWGGVGGSMLNLNGGTLSTARLIQDGAGWWAPVHFNGGMLQAAKDMDPIINVVTALVDAGGARIDTQGYYVRIPQGLQHGTGSPDGGLTKVGSGTLTLNGANTYNGSTIVSEGILNLPAGSTITASLDVTVAAGANMTLADTGNVLSDLAAVTLNGTMTLGEGVNETVGGLCFGTTFQAAGTWGSSTSAAANKDDTHFSGTGMLTVAQPQALIMSFTMPGARTTLSATDITCVLGSGTSVTNLAPTYTLSAGATCDKASGSIQDFTTPQTYTVISSDALVTNVYVVTVNVVQTPVIDGLALWVDASQLTGLSDGDQVDTWTDFSGFGNNAIRQGGSSVGYPMYKTDVINGQPVVRFNSRNQNTGDYFKFNRITNIRTVFWVLKENPGSHDAPFLLGDDYEYFYDFHRPYANGPLWCGHTSGNILTGTTRLMGEVIDGTATPLPSGSFQLVSLVTAGNVQANQITQDRRYHGSWQGDIAEILIYNRALTPDEETAVGSYLANKYGLTTTYPVTPEAEILTFNLLGNWAVITGTNIVCTVPYSTVLTNLAPTYATSLQATCVPASGATNDFTNPVAYTVVSSDLLTTNVYTVTVVKAPPKSDKDILTFGGAPGLPGVISGTEISWTVPCGTDLANLAPTYTVSPLASGSPASGVPNDFTAPATYTVTAEDGSTKEYTVTVTVLSGLTVKTYDDTAGETYLNPITNLMAVTPSATGMQGVDIAYSGDFYTELPGLTANSSFSILWEGWFDVSKDGPGVYTFVTASDDGSVLFLDLNGDGDFTDPGECIIDNNRIQGVHLAMGEVNLKMSAVRIAIGYFQGDGNYEMHARFKKGAGVSYDSMQYINSLSGYFYAEQPTNSLSVATLWDFGRPGVFAYIKGTHISWLLPYGTDVTTLAPTYMMNAGATGSPASGSVTDFTSPVSYTVISADETVTNVYTVTATVLPESPVIYVDTEARGTADGLSWANATTLTNALAMVNPVINFNALWLAQGTYVNPSGMFNDGGVMYGFLANQPVMLYGGFTNGMATLAERDWTTYPTILNGEGMLGVMNVRASNVRLDGVTIENGYASNGGGLVKASIATNLVIANSRFTGNRCWSAGGGAFFDRGTITLTNCWFEDNHPEQSRGHHGNAIYTTYADVTMVGCTFTNNSSNWEMRDGRASCMVVDHGILTVRNTRFLNNRYSQQNTGGGAASLNGDINALFENCHFVHNGGDSAAQGPGGALFMEINNGSAVTVDRCAFVANAIEKAGTGGGAIYKGGHGALNVENCTFFTNAVAGAATGGALYVSGGAITAHNSILWSNVAAGGGSEINLAGGSMEVSYSDLTGTNAAYVAGEVLFSDVMTEDPLFAGGLDVHLQAKGGRWNPATETWETDAVDSPCIDAGDPASSYALEPKYSTNKRINMGAYGNTPEASYALPPPKGTVIRLM